VPLRDLPEIPDVTEPIIAHRVWTLYETVSTKPGPWPKRRRRLPYRLHPIVMPRVTWPPLEPREARCVSDNGKEPEGRAALSATLIPDEFMSSWNEHR
jgi:hypothetical protein